VRLNLVRSLGMAIEGPIPMIRGARPATVAPTYLARIGWPSSMARERLIRRTAAAGKNQLVSIEWKGKHTAISNLR